MLVMIICASVKASAEPAQPALLSLAQFGLLMCVRMCVFCCHIFLCDTQRFSRGRGGGVTGGRRRAGKKHTRFQMEFKGWVKKCRRRNSISLGRCFPGDLERGNINNANERLGARRGAPRRPGGAERRRVKKERGPNTLCERDGWRRIFQK